MILLSPIIDTLIDIIIQKLEVMILLMIGFSIFSIIFREENLETNPYIVVTPVEMKHNSRAIL